MTNAIPIGECAFCGGAATLETCTLIAPGVEGPKTKVCGDCLPKTFPALPPCNCDVCQCYGEGACDEDDPNFNMQEI